MNYFRRQIKGKKVLVFGLGRQGGGQGDFAWLEQNGAVARVSDRDLTLCSEGQTKEQIEWADMIIKNPGVSDQHELIIYAKTLKIPVYTSIALFVKYAGLTTIGVTGTRGKSTTVDLITKVLSKAYPAEVIAGGNIPGTSGLSLFDVTDGKRYAVLELSSFQLHNFHDLRVSPNVALITNLYPDHLNRYDSMEDYQADKVAICAYQKSADLCLYNRDNVGSTKIASHSAAKLVSFSQAEVETWPTNLPGLHNRENIAGMARLISELGIDVSLAKEVVADYQGLPFRQEKIAQKHGVTYINDTTSTTPTAAIKALQAAVTPTIWITGGDDKQLPYTDLLQEIARNPHLKGIVILGSKNIPAYIAQLKAIVSDKILGTAHSMAEAVSLASRASKAGDSILLSPGFSSFDLFQNEFDRGRQFNECVKNIST